MNPLLPLTSFQDLVSLLQHDKVPYRLQAEEQLLEMPTVSGVLRSSIFVRWEKSLPLLQLILPLQIQVPPERISAMESALCRINNAIAMPGFGINYDKLTVYNRLTVPRDAEGNIKVELVRRMLLSLVTNGRQFVVTLRALAGGQIEPAGVLAHAVEVFQNKGAEHPAAAASKEDEPQY
jgi:hypothetical protein